MFRLSGGPLAALILAATREQAAERPLPISKRDVVTREMRDLDQQQSQMFSYLSGWEKRLSTPFKSPRAHLEL